MSGYWCPVTVAAAVVVVIVIVGVVVVVVVFPLFLTVPNWCNEAGKTDDAPLVSYKLLMTPLENDKDGFR